MASSGANTLQALGQNATGLVESIGDRIGHLTGLAKAEARLAFSSVLALIVMLVLWAISILMIWGLALAAVLSLLQFFGIPAFIGASALAVIHALAAFGFWRKSRTLIHRITLPALREALGDLVTIRSEQGDTTPGADG